MITVTKTDFQQLSPRSQNELLQAVTGGFELHATGNPAIEDEDLANLSNKQARLFVKGLSEKTRKVALMLASSSDGVISLEDFYDAFDMEDDLVQGRAIWAGLTKRVRTVTGDDEAEFVEWIGGGRSVRVSNTTHKSLKVAFQI